VVLYRMVTGVYLPPCTDGGEPVEREVLPPSAMATVSLELEALTLRLLSEDRQARGTAEQLERDVQVLVETAGPEADRPILSTPSAVPTEEGGRASSDGQDDDELLSDTEPAHPPGPRSTGEERYRRRPAFPAWLSLASAGLVSGMVVALAVLVVQPSRPEPAFERSAFLATPEELAQFATDGGVAEEALATVQNAPRAVMPLVLTVGEPIPKKPPEGQKKPPCGPGQVAINGACWAGPIKGQEAPCQQGMFDHEGECYFAIYDAPRQPTSGTP
jgi:hypothetical protein